MADRQVGLQRADVARPEARRPEFDTLGISMVQSSNGGKTWSAAQRLDAQPFSTNWVPHAQGGRMIGDYLSTSYAGSRVVPVFALATSPLNGRLREAIFSESLRSLG